MEPKEDLVDVDDKDLIDVDDEDLDDVGDEDLGDVDGEDLVELDQDARGSAELGPNSAGQSGDLQGLHDCEDGESENVTSLLEEGQYYEASVLSGIDNAPNADESEVKTKQVLEDDMPGEYLDEVEFRK